MDDRVPGRPLGCHVRQAGEDGYVSSPPPVRRTDKQMSDADARDMLAKGHCGRLATVGADGSPYCVPLLYGCLDGEIFVHNTAARGHLRSNVDHEPRICFEVDEVGEVFDYGRFECDVSISHRSIIAFGRIRVIEDRALKQRFCDARPSSGRHRTRTKTPDARP